MNDVKRAMMLYRLAGGGDGWVYFITAGPFAKIGWAFNPRKRLVKLQTACPFRMEIAATVRGSKHLERDYQLRFILQRSGASVEWFHLRGDLLDYIRHLKAGGKPMWEPGGFEWHDDPFTVPLPEVPVATALALQARRRAGASHVELAREFGIGPSHAGKLCRGVRRGAPE